MLLLFSVNKLFSQENSKPGKLSGFRMEIGPGYSYIDPSSISSINASLTSKGFAGVPNDFPSWNMRFPIIIRNSVLDIDFNGFIKRNMVNSNSRTTTTGSFWKLGYGYMISAGKHSLICPSIGIDFGNMNVHSHQETTPVNDVSATNSFYMLDLSLGWDYLPSEAPSTSIFSDSKSPMGRIFTGNYGITAGIAFSPYTSFWNDNNIDLSNTHNSNVNFVTDVVGINTTAKYALVYLKLRIGIGMVFRGKGNI
jgi:hypothetical protein